MRFEDRIALDPAVRGGKPCIRGTRITVYDVLEYLAAGMSEDEILSDFPSLRREDIRAVLFRQRAFLYGPPPQGVWLSVGNAGTAVIARLLGSNVARLEAFAADADQALLIVAAG